MLFCVWSLLPKIVLLKSVHGRIQQLFLTVIVVYYSLVRLVICSVIGEVLVISHFLVIADSVSANILVHVFW